MGREEIAALIAILQDQLDKGTENIALGSWHIHYEKKRNVFIFDKCENDGYCEERPSVVAASGEVLDRGGPLFG
ncbi:MAG: hypothetical protein IT303_13315 [Dehalococcoidia bacterium]|nr:hypothetical protein [Dehalococcoidia bacterium]